MMGAWRRLKEEDLIQRDVAQGSSGLYGIYLYRRRTFQEQTALKRFQTAVYGCFQLSVCLYDVVEGFQMVLKGPAGQIAVAGDVDQSAAGIPPSEFPSQQKTVPFSVFELHVQNIDVVPALPQSLKKLFGRCRAAHDLHVIIFNEDFLLQYGPDPAAGGFVIVAQINIDHGLPPGSSMVSSWINIPSLQRVAADAFGYFRRIF